MPVKPLYDRILARRAEEEAHVSAGIIIPDSAKEKPQQAEILAVGKGKRLEDGTVVELDVKVGDQVLIGKYSGTDISVEDEDLIILREDEILGVLDR